MKHCKSRVFIIFKLSILLYSLHIIEAVRADLTNGARDHSDQHDSQISVVDLPVARSKRYIMNNNNVFNRLHQQLENKHKQHNRNRKSKKRNHQKLESQDQVEQEIYEAPYVKKHRKRSRQFLDILHGEKNTEPIRKPKHNKYARKSYFAPENLFEDQRVEFKKQQQPVFGEEVKTIRRHPNSIPGEEMHFTNDLSQEINDMFTNFQSYKMDQIQMPKQPILFESQPRTQKPRYIGVSGHSNKMKRIKLPFVGIMQKKRIP